MINATLTHLLKAPYWWLVYLAPLAGLAFFLATQSTDKYYWELVGRVVFISGIAYYNIIVIGACFSQKLTSRFVRKDAEWNGWHTVGLAQAIFVGLVGLLFAIAFLVSFLAQQNA